MRTGPLVLVQDLGRPGHRAVGISAGGAADRGALRLVNRLLGNAEDQAALEVLLGGLTVTATRDLLVAVTGAPAPATVAARPIGHASVLRLHAGATLSLGTPHAGLRSYLGVRGGIATEVMLGARSTDLLAGLGRPVRAGDVLDVGAPVAHLPDVDQALLHQDRVLRVSEGPRADWVRGGLGALCAPTWTVTTDLDRVGVRLSGPPLQRAAEGELASEGVLPGAVQVPPDGRPVLFLADAPVTGGYPVVGVLDGHSLDRAAQLRPGDTVQLTPMNH